MVGESSTAYRKCSCIECLISAPEVCLRIDGVVGPTARFAGAVLGRKGREKAGTAPLPLTHYSFSLPLSHFHVFGERKTFLRPFRPLLNLIRYHPHQTPTLTNQPNGAYISCRRQQNGRATFFYNVEAPADGEKTEGVKRWGTGREAGRSTPERKGIRRGRLKGCAGVFPIPLRSVLSGLRAIPRFGL